jgi:hypothetical protein
VAERLSRVTSPATGTATTEPESTTTPAAKPEDEAEKELALSALLTPDDEPGIETEGEAEAIWTAGSNRGREAGNPFAARCLGGRATWRLLVQARAPRFVVPSGNVQNGLFVFEDAQQATDALGAYARPAMRECFADGLVEQLRTGMRIDGGTGVSVGRVQVSARDVDELGDGSTAMRITLPIRAEGEGGTFFIDIVLVRQERAIGMLSTLIFGEPAPDDVLQQLAERVADRLDEVYG